MAVNPGQFPVSSSPYSGATPTTPYSGTFIPEIWSGKILEKFYSATVLAAIANTDYEGAIKNQGDSVRIRTKPTITIRDYEADQALTVERPSAPTIELQINKGKYFAVTIDDVIEVQSDINMLSMWSDDAGQQMKITVDTAVLATIDAGVVAANKGIAAGKLSASLNLGAAGTPFAATPANVLDAIVDMGTALDEQNIPETGRWLIIPPWMSGMIKKSDLRNASVSGDGVSLLRNGRIGMIDRFTLYGSNLLPTASEGSATATRIFAGHPHGLTFAGQINKVETLRTESSFGTTLRGLFVYGSSVLDGIALTEMYAVRG